MATFGIILIFAGGFKQTITMEYSQVVEKIKQVAADVLPKGSSVYLYGSRARGDARPDSDWDLLILLDKPQVAFAEKEIIEFPFVDVGWDIGEDISARAYTKRQWFDGRHPLFFFNVENDKKVIYES